VRALPPELAARIEACPTALDAARGADAVVVATEWPELREVELAAVLSVMKGRVVVDANRFLAARTAGLDLVYRAVGAPAPGGSRGG
jgi:UDPglucose 6-dehydrogenase